jgi:predicted AlkP superfamily pyrophosphatase or phosphodiesterase
MRKLRLIVPLFVTFGFLSAAAEAPKPKLVLAIVVDQFRYDYLTRFRSGYNGGLEQLLTKGAVYTNARYIHFPTVTAVGHSTFLSGALPAVSGIISNDWYDRELKKNVTSVSDPKETLLGATGEASSPRRLLVSTVGDELRSANAKSKVIGISLKDRAAILPAGHMANGAYWFDNKTGAFVSSTFYFPELPGWVKDFNGTHPANKYAGQEWMGKKFVEPGEKLNESLAASPWGNELIEAFAERAVESEQLGKRGITDLLAVSFSSNDYVGHAVGPDDPQVQDMAIRTDILFRKLFAFIDKQVGMKDVLVVFTADHGVAPTPEMSKQRKLEAGRFPAGATEKPVEAALEAKFGPGKWIEKVVDGGTMLYLNHALIHEKNLDSAQVDRVAADAARSIPHIFRAYTREQLMNGQTGSDISGRAVANGFFPPRGADVVVIQEPYWLFGGISGTSHGTPFGYDTHVPVIFMGPGIKPGKYYDSVTVNDIAPTLATLLSVEIPSGAAGRVLAEMFTKDVN